MNLIDEIECEQEYQEHPESSEQMEMYSGREEIWENDSEPSVFIEWVVKAGGEKVDYYAYIQTGKDGDISTPEAITWWETSLKN